MSRGPGIYYDISEEEYFADPCERPSLTSSLAKLLCSQSPLHAWTASPRLNPDWQPQVSEVFDRGHVVHALLLEGVDKAAPIVSAVDSKGVKKEVTDWRMGDAQRQRDEARAAGKIPMLSYQYEAALDMVNAVNKQLDASKVKPRPFSAGRPEVTIIWEEEGVLCRSRLDWLFESMMVIDDLKTLQDANPETIARKAFGDGWDIQAATCIRGIEVLTGQKPKFRFVPVEADPPHALSVIVLDQMSLDLGEKKRRHALEIFRTCLESGVWPGYPPMAAIVELPAWEDKRWSDKELLSIGVSA